MLVESARPPPRVIMDADSGHAFGLHTGQADQQTFMAAARACYEHARIPWHGNVVWASSPLVVALAAPAAALLIALKRCGHGAQHDRELEGALHAMAQGTVGALLWKAVCQLVAQALPDPVQRIVFPLERAVDLAVGGTVAEGLQTTAGLPRFMGGDDGMRPLRLAVRAGVHAALARAGAEGSALQLALREVIARTWFRYISGQRRVAFGVLLNEVFGGGDLYERERVYELAAEGSCCWHPHREFVVASEWPLEIQVAPLTPGVHITGQRRYRSDGATAYWSDGWGVRALRGDEETDGIPTVKHPPE